MQHAPMPITSAHDVGNPSHPQTCLLTTLRLFGQTVNILSLPETQPSFNVKVHARVYGVDERQGSQNPLTLRLEYVRNMFALELSMVITWCLSLLTWY